MKQKKRKERDTK